MDNSPGGSKLYVGSSPSRMLPLLSIFLTSACMSGGGEPPDRLAILAAKTAAANQMIADFSPVQYTEFDVIPTTGSATYTGHLLGQLSNLQDNVTDSFIGDLSINVSFENTDMVTGIANGFLDDQGNELTGQIDLRGGTLDGEGDPSIDSTMFFEGGGDLIDVGGTTLELDFDFSGDFLGEEYNALGGDVLGQVSVGEADQAFGGVFIAIR